MREIELESPDEEPDGAAPAPRPGQTSITLHLPTGAVTFDGVGDIAIPEDYLTFESGGRYHGFRKDLVPRFTMTGPVKPRS